MLGACLERVVKLLSRSYNPDSSEDQFNAGLAQLDRVAGFEPVGRGFESLILHRFNYLVTA